MQVSEVLKEPKKEVLVASKRTIMASVALPSASTARAVAVSGSSTSVSGANFANHVGAVTVGNTVQTSGGQKVTIVNANPSGQGTGISKTIVVVPVSSNNLGNGDASQPVLKKIKTTN